VKVGYASIDDYIWLGRKQVVNALNNTQRTQFFLPTLVPTITPKPLPTITPLPTLTPSLMMPSITPLPTLTPSVTVAPPP
jgi:hypothetical protein